jgi:hypothetical protein
MVMDFTKQDIEKIKSDLLGLLEFVCLPPLYVRDIFVLDPSREALLKADNLYPTRNDAQRTLSRYHRTKYPSKAADYRYRG